MSTRERIRAEIDTWPEDRLNELYELVRKARPSPPPVQPRDEWERKLLGAATDCGVSLPDAALSSDGLYE
jgi:hypothetical protein